MQPIHPLVVRERVQYYVNLDEPKAFDIGVAGAITGAFNSALRGNDKSMYAAALHRRQVWGWVLVRDNNNLIECHSRTLSPPEWNALYRWLGADWKKKRLTFDAEARWVYQWAIVAFNAMIDKSSMTMCEAINLAQMQLDPQGTGGIGNNGNH